MRQRAASRAARIEPDVLLMDEPFGARGAQNRPHHASAIIWRETGRTIVS